VPHTFAKTGESMTRLRLRTAGITVAARRLGVPALAAAMLAGPAAGSAAAAAPIAPGFTTAAAGAPAVPNLLLNGTVNQPVSGKLPGSGNGTTTFTVTTPNLMPPGITVTPGGLITGIPTADGIYGVTVSACGTSGCTPGTATFTIAPDAAPCDNQPNMTPSPGSLGIATVAGS
jgi:large repetitive protein